MIRRHITHAIRSIPTQIRCDHVYAKFYLHELVGADFLRLQGATEAQPVKRTQLHRLSATHTTCYTYRSAKVLRLQGAMEMFAGFDDLQLKASFDVRAAWKLPSYLADSATKWDKSVT